jgi:type IV secretory pathway TraG/TraD family ATPase VirD4
MVRMAERGFSLPQVAGLTEEITSSQGEARRRLMTPDELRTMPVDSMLMIEAAAAPLILKTKVYFEDKELAARANIPYQVTHVRPEPSMPSYAQSLPPAATGKAQKGPPIVVDGDIEDEDDQDSQYILNE